MYRIISPSRTNKLPSPTHFPYGRGVSERRWRSAANRLRRQPRRGWASLYEAPSQKKNHLPHATKIQQPKNFTPAPTSPPAPPPHKKSLPTLPPEPNIGRLGLFRAKHGPIWVRTGLFRVDFGLFRVKIGPFWASFPSREPLSSPGDVQKLHLPARAPKRTLFLTLSQNHTKYRVFITNNSKFTPLSL